MPRPPGRLIPLAITFILRSITWLPAVLVSDKLSETAVQIFRDRGVEVDYKPDLGKDKDALLAPSRL